MEDKTTTQIRISGVAECTKFFARDDIVFLRVLYENDEECMYALVDTDMVFLMNVSLKYFVVNQLYAIFVTEGKVHYTRTQNIIDHIHNTILRGDQCVESNDKIRMHVPKPIDDLMREFKFEPIFHNKPANVLLIIDDVLTCASEDKVLATHLESMKSELYSIPYSCNDNKNYVGVFELKKDVCLLWNFGDYFVIHNIDKNETTRYDDKIVFCELNVNTGYTRIIGENNVYIGAEGKINIHPKDTPIVFHVFGVEVETTFVARDGKFVTLETTIVTDETTQKFDSVVVSNQIGISYTIDVQNSTLTITKIN